MSIELLLTMIAFLLVPLIQHMVEAARAGQKPKPAPPAGMPPSGRKPPSREQQLLVLEDRRLTNITAAPEGKPSRYSDRPLTPPIPRSRRGTAVLGLRYPLDLRRAIVLTTVLGPCRAIHPFDWPEGHA